MPYTYDRTAASKFEVYDALMAVHRKAMQVEGAGVSAVLAKINKTAKPFGYELDMGRSYIGFRTGRSDMDSPEGEIWFKPLPSRKTWASEAEMREWVTSTLDLWSISAKGDGQYVAYLGG